MQYHVAKLSVIHKQTSLWINGDEALWNKWSAGAVRCKLKSCSIIKVYSSLRLRAKVHKTQTKFRRCLNIFAFFHISRLLVNDPNDFYPWINKPFVKLKFFFVINYDPIFPSMDGFNDIDLNNILSKTVRVPHVVFHLSIIYTVYLFLSAE